MIALLFAWLFLTVAPASAEENVQLDEIVVTANRIAEPVAETTSSVTLITQDDIEKMHVEFLPDVFRKIPGLHVVQSGGTGTVASVLLRGGSSSQTLVLIDGIRVNSTTTGSFDFSGVSASDIERIEIVKGPQSTVYGSDAMAGVISIITKKGRGKVRTNVSIEAGSNGTINPTATLAGIHKTVDYRFTGTYFQTDGISAADAGTEPDGNRNAAISGKVGFSPAEHFSMEFTGRYSYDRSELDGFDFFSSKAIDDRNFVQRGHHRLLSGKANIALRPVWDQTISLSLAEDSLSFRDPDTDYNNAKIDTAVKTVDWQHAVAPSKSYSVVAGLEYRREEGDNPGNFNESLDNYALYLNNKLLLFDGMFVMTAGLRYDDLDISGSKATYRCGAVYRIPRTGVKIRGSYGTGFRAPALNELFFPYYGNRTLKPEETTSWEAGIAKDCFEGTVQISLTYFDQEYENLISTNPVTFTASNIADARVKGIETSLSMQITSHVKLKAGYTYLDTEDVQTGGPLPLRPQDKLNIAIDLSIKNLVVAADYLFIGQRFDSSVGRNLSSYSVINLSSSLNVFRGITLFVRGENLLDERYEELGSFGTPGLSVYGGMSVSL